MAESGWTAFGSQRAEADMHPEAGIVSVCPKLPSKEGLQK
jgi:hypothetical protein